MIVITPLIGLIPIEVLYGKPCRSTYWLDIRDPMIVGPEMIEETIKIVELIRKRMEKNKIMRMNLEFEVGDNVFLRIWTNRRVSRFDKCDKLSPRYVG